MEKRRRVLLFGNSVILGTVGASLRNFTNLEVTSLTATLPKETELKALATDVVFFDLEATRPDMLFSLLENCPGLLLVGLSPDSNLVKMWTGRQLRELSTQDLLKVIDGQMKDSTVL